MSKWLIILQGAQKTPSLMDVTITNTSDIILHTNVIPCHVADHELIITVTLNIRKSKRPLVLKFRESTKLTQ